MKLAIVTGGVVVVLTATWFVNWHFRSTQASNTSSLRDIGVIELGEVESGQVAMGELTIINDGNVDLMIDGVRASCSCTGIETRNPDGSYTQLSSLTVPANGQVPVVVRLAVNGLVGGQLNSTIYFLTNDPAKPEVTLHVRLSRITHGARATPEVIPIGIMPVGKKTTHSVDIVDRSPTPRSVERMVVTNDKLISATLIPVPENEATVPGGRIVARLQVQVDAKSPAQVDERVNVWLVSETPKSPVSIRIIGRIAATVELSPETLVFPINTDAGPICRASVLCLTHGSPAQLRVVDCPSKLTVTLPSGTTSGAPQQIKIEQKSAGLEPYRETITLGVTVNGVETTHLITIICNP